MMGRKIQALLPEELNSSPLNVEHSAWQKEVDLSLHFPLFLFVRFSSYLGDWKNSVKRKLLSYPMICLMYWTEKQFDKTQTSILLLLLLLIILVLSISLLFWRIFSDVLSDFLQSSTCVCHFCEQSLFPLTKILPI